MKLKKPVVKKLLRTLEDVRELVDDSTPRYGCMNRTRLDKAYDAILSVEDVLRRKDDSRERGS